MIICDAASIPSCLELISIEVSCGDVDLANRELLKEMIDKIFRDGKHDSVDTLFQVKRQEYHHLQRLQLAVHPAVTEKKLLLCYLLIHSELPRSILDGKGIPCLVNAIW